MKVLLEIILEKRENFPMGISISKELKLENLAIDS